MYDIEVKLRFIGIKEHRYKGIKMIIILPFSIS